MSKLFLAAAVAAFTLTVAGASAAPTASVPQTPIESTAILAKARQLGVIPANCTIDPFAKPKVYNCCTTDSSGNTSCTTYPIDHDFPVQRFQKLHQFQTQPGTVQPGMSTQ